MMSLAGGHVVADRPHGRPKPHLYGGLSIRQDGWPSAPERGISIPRLMFGHAALTLERSLNSELGGQELRTTTGEEF